MRTISSSSILYNKVAVGKGENVMTKNNQKNVDISSYLDQFKVHEFQNRLLYWFERNMRDLPWRQDKDPYKIWVSEIMLQQTQVDTVIPYYHRFLERFPTIESLADAHEEDVLKMWEGLGYYSRARNLQQAVKEVREHYGGKVPENTKEILSLKGVGSYTAGAILSIAYGKREPAVDGNVMRVMSRILTIYDDIQKAKTKSLFEGIVKQLIPADSTSYFNQGLMELGALICTPQKPKCEQCPVQTLCRAYEQNVQNELPVKTKKKKQKTQHMVAGVLVCNGHVLIRKRPDTGLLAKLYEFPNTEWLNNSARDTISTYYKDQFSVFAEAVQEWTSVQHTFTHLIWNITVYAMELADKYNLESNDDDSLVTINTNEIASSNNRAKWVPVDELDEYAFPVSHQKIKAELKKKLSFIGHA